MDDIQHTWRLPADNLRLGVYDVHVWRASVAQPAATIQYLKSMLSPEEVAKAERFYFERDRNRHIVVHALLRILLSRYLDTDRDQLQFIHNEYGKPFVKLEETQPALQFNISHSHELVLYAFTLSRQIGVDVEYMRPDIEYEALAQYHFSLLENSMLREVPAEFKQQAFYNCWSRKEAYIKARGMGLSLPLDIFDVSLKPGEDAALLGSREEPPQLPYWSLRALLPGESYAGALVVEGHDWHMHCWQYLF